jgi:hypothetical protein
MTGVSPRPAPHRAAAQKHRRRIAVRQYRVHRQRTGTAIGGSAISFCAARLIKLRVAPGHVVRACLPLRAYGEVHTHLAYGGVGALALVGGFLGR